MGGWGVWSGAAGLRIVAQPQPGELCHEGPHQLPHLGDHHVLVAVVHAGARPVEGAGDDLPAVHHRELVVQGDGRPVETHADPCWTERERERAREVQTRPCSSGGPSRLCVCGFGRSRSKC